MRFAAAFVLLLIATLFTTSLSSAQEAGSAKFIQLFNGRDLSGFDIKIRDRELNRDPNDVFQVQDGVIRASGKEYGYIITKKEYENYHLKLEFKWGVPTYEPRKDKARDSGILFHVVGPQKVWPKSIEFQMIEGRTGEVILVGDGASLTVKGETKTRGQGGSTRFARYGQGPWEDKVGYRDPEGEVEKPHGEWNLLELIATDGAAKYLVNGKVVNQGTGAVPARGKILFQSEGAELFFRNIEIRTFE